MASLLWKCSSKYLSTNQQIAFIILTTFGQWKLIPYWLILITGPKSLIFMARFRYLCCRLFLTHSDIRNLFNYKTSIITRTPIGSANIGTI
ncbi:hypothetical protein GDO86_010671 [Hymenochirus boettgeri]|uniref:Uncharacterized protein n=1 Tax=Hymenochirus boettgeri TaxID=247094 RepID=A0A8T2J8J0_9PIPI|nr:hypothetical protein GDO86_010671 [Hymenochirus boettgeri]